MGDRCWIKVTCRKDDAARFEALGFDETTEPELTPDSLLVVDMEDEEANYAHSGKMPTDIPYFGQNADGGGYGAALFACDGKKYAEIECNHDEDPVVRVIKGKPCATDLKRVKEYLAVLKATMKILGVTQVAGAFGAA